MDKKRDNTFNKKLIIIVATVLIVTTVLIVVCVNLFAADTNITINDKDGNTIATIKDINLKKVTYVNPDYASYVDIVLEEAKEQVGQSNVKFGKIVIDTNFDKDIFEACTKAYGSTEFGDNVPFAISIVDVSGAVLCTYSKGPMDNDELVNYASEKTQAYSSFKPLSVYAPAIEKGVITFSTSYLDAPLKKITKDSGESVDWPTNGNGKYLNTEVTVADAIKQSLNTVAVRALQDYGVTNSINFLSENFNIDLEWEKKQIKKNGEDEVLSSIGLGYLYEGVSPLDMSGFYEIFANDGKYEKPHSIKTIFKNGKSIYDYSKQDIVVKQVLTSETAYIMNQLLKQPLEYGGTASNAATVSVPLGGKTGTGTDYLGNWMVGFTPEYICSVWHGYSDERQNICAKTFGVLIENMKLDDTKYFAENHKVVLKDYMSLDGIRTGFYLPE